MALNEHEEGFLRRFIRENMPLAPPPAQPLAKQDESIQPVIERELAKGKRGFVSMEEDKEFIARVKHTLRPKEKLAQWLARTLITRAQALAMTPAELSARVKQIEEHDAAEGPREPRRPASPFVPVDEVPPQNRSRFLVVG